MNRTEKIIIPTVIILIVVTVFLVISNNQLKIENAELAMQYYSSDDFLEKENKILYKELDSLQEKIEFLENSLGQKNLEYEWLRQLQDYCLGNGGILPPIEPTEPFKMT